MKINRKNNPVKGLSSDQLVAGRVYVSYSGTTEYVVIGASISDVNSLATHILYLDTGYLVSIHDRKNNVFVPAPNAELTTNI